MLQLGTSVLALLGFGALVDGWGAHAYFSSAAFAATGVLCIHMSLRLKAPVA